MVQNCAYVKINMRTSLPAKVKYFYTISLLRFRDMHEAKMARPAEQGKCFHIFYVLHLYLQLLRQDTQNLRGGIKTSSFLQSSRSGLSPQPLSPQSSVLVLPSSASVSSPRRLRLNCGCDLASSRPDNIYLTLQTSPTISERK